MRWRDVQEAARFCLGALGAAGVFWRNFDLRDGGPKAAGRLLSSMEAGKGMMRHGIRALRFSGMTPNPTTAA